jgi:ribose-phosphate pyrophosphokinase
VRPLIVALPDNDDLAGALGERCDGERAALTVHRFPDGESYVRVESAVDGREVVLACTLDRPDGKVVPLVLVAATAKDLGAARVGLVAPYLPYLRQDRRFRSGEGVTSRYFAALLSGAVDWIVTVDPHLHRLASLAAVYRVPAVAVHAAPLLAAWIRTHVPDAVLVGPDAESAQWTAAVAAAADVPHVVGSKVRHGDHDVTISLPEFAAAHARTPVLIDDVISTGGTMIATVERLRSLGTRPPVCVAVHGVFAERAYEDLLAAGAARIVTCNTIRHPSNAIDVSGLLADGVREIGARRG